MQSPISRYIRLAERWTWLVVLGMFICGGVTYFISKHIPPVYQASATIVLEFGTDPFHAFDNVSASLQATQTYAQLVTSPTVLGPVLANHPGMTLQQLDAMITVKPEPSTQLIDVDVQNRDPRLAMQLANEVCQSFAQLANTQLPGTVQILPAILPTDPIRKPLQDGGIGALVGLGLALALIVLFEWIDDRLSSFEQVQELLGMEVLTTIPKLSRKERLKQIGETTLAERCRILCAGLNALWAAEPFKLVLITSALADEGKSTIAANLAIFLATAGKHVLLIDANLHRPVLDQHFGLDNRRGFSNALQEAWTPHEIGLNAHETDIPTLRVLTAGMPLSNPADLLQSPLTTQLFNHVQKAPFDYVIFDAPPLLPVADTQLLALHVQAAMLVVDVSKTPRKALLRAKQLLNRTRIMMLGTALNKSSWSGEIHRYRSYRQQLKVDTIMITPPDTPPIKDLADPSIADIPTGKLADPITPMDGLVDPDNTLTLSRQPKLTTTDE